MRLIPGFRYFVAFRWPHGRRLPTIRPMNATTPTPKRRRTIVAIFLLAAASGAVIAAGPWSGETVKGNGSLRTQERAVSGFTGVALSIPAEVELRMGASEGVLIEADENLLPHIETVMKGGTLELRAAGRVKLEPRTLRVVVNARAIEHLSVAGGGSIAGTTLKTPRLGLEIGGAGKIALQELQSESVDASIGGSGNMKLGGSARKLAISIAGSGGVDTQQLKSDDVNVSIAGSGDAKVWPVNSLKSSIAGSGDVRYFGDPKANQVQVAGTGAVRRAGNAPR